MIPETAPACQSPWQTEIKNLISDPAQLLTLLELPMTLLPAAQQASSLFPLKVSRPFVARIRLGDQHDPLLQQILPLDLETATVPGFTTDPLQEQHVNQRPGLLHKYNNRVLLITTGTCAINCRYCFRRHFPYQANNPGRLGWQQSLDYLAADTNIQEVILSGGDPLMLSDQTLAWFFHELSAITHVQIVRLHTRLPIVIPQRITTACLKILTSTRLTPVVVLHCNHAQEIDAAVAHAARMLKAAGITLLNQAVLLRGVNDNTSALITLSHALFAAGILPYYLHLCDRVAGAAHFYVPPATAIQLHQYLQQNLPGYLVPRLVHEQPGAGAKVSLT